MNGDAYIEPNDVLLQSPVNRDFDEIRRMSEAKFRSWAGSLRDEVARVWEQEGAPPFFRFTTEEIVAQFQALSRYDVSDLLTRDELRDNSIAFLPTANLVLHSGRSFPTSLKPKTPATRVRDTAFGTISLSRGFSIPS